LNLLTVELQKRCCCCCCSSKAAQRKAAKQAAKQSRAVQSQGELKLYAQLVSASMMDGLGLSLGNAEMVLELERGRRASTPQAALFAVVTMWTWTSVDVNDVVVDAS